MMVACYEMIAAVTDWHAKLCDCEHGTFRMTCRITEQLGLGDPVFGSASSDI